MLCPPGNRLRVLTPAVIVATDDAHREQVFDDRNVDAQTRPIIVVLGGGEVELRFELVMRTFGDEIDRASERGAAKIGRLRPLDDFDAFDVVEGDAGRLPGIVDAVDEDRSDVASRVAGRRDLRHAANGHARDTAVARREEDQSRRVGREIF